MESYGYSTDDLVFQWAKESPIQVKEDLVIPRYKMEKTETDDCTKVYSTGRGVPSCQSRIRQRSKNYELTLLRK